MIRILGVISGAAISIAALTWFVGVPQFTSERVASDEEVGMPLVVGSEIKSPEPAVVTPADVLSSKEQEALPAVLESDTDQYPTPADTDTVTAQLDAAAPASTVELEVPEIAVIVPTSEPNWFAFWSPFRSEIAANGFVGELQRVTGLDYRVVKVKPGVYEVAFAYSDNDEIDSNLSTISAATGLNLPGNQ